MSHKTAGSSASTITVGLDLGDRFCRYCEMDFQTGVIAEGRLRTTAEALRRQFAGREPLRIVMEVGTHSPWVPPSLARRAWPRGPGRQCPQGAPHLRQRLQNR